MDANDLRNHALAVLHRRLALPRSYCLVGQDGLRITVNAAIVESDSHEVTESNPCNRDTLRQSGPPDDGTSFLWNNATGAKGELLSFAQVRFLAGSLNEFNRIIYDVLSKVCGEIGAGSITTPEQIDNAPWPSSSSNFPGRLTQHVAPWRGEHREKTASLDLRRAGDEIKPS
jgi:hypothetical protein